MGIRKLKEKFIWSLLELLSQQESFNAAHKTVECCDLVKDCAYFVYTHSNHYHDRQIAIGLTAN